MEKKTYIIQVTENECKMIETNVPFEEIKEFIDFFCEECESEEDESEDDYVNHAEYYLAKEYPKIYDAKLEAGVYNDKFFKGVEELCNMMGIDTERFIDEMCAAYINQEYDVVSGFEIIVALCCPKD